MADQAVSSLTNFAVGIVVARGLGLAEFGAFTLAWTTYSLVINISRGLGTDPLVVRFSGVPAASWRKAVSSTSAVAVLVGLVAGVLCLGIGVVFSGPVGGALAALGLVLPALLLQDSWRFAFFAAGEGRRAFVNDAVWAAALVPAMLVASQMASIVSFVLAWGLSAAVAAAYGFAQARVALSLSGARSWFRQQRDLGVRYLVENVSLSGGAQLRMYGLGAIAGLADVGAVRGAQLLLGPLLAVLMGISVVAVPEAAGWLRRSRRSLRQFCLVLGSTQALAALVWGLGLLFLLPVELGDFLLGDVWQPASILILPMSLAVVMASFAAGATTGLRALGAARRSLRSQLFETATYLTATLIGAVIGGALGSTWGGALASLLALVVWWTQLHAAVREPENSAPGRPDPLRHDDIVHE